MRGAFSRELEQLRRTEYVDAYYMAMLRDALGQRQEAFAELERAFHENSAFLYSIEIDPKMERLRSDARFARIRRDVSAPGSRAVDLSGFWANRTDRHEHNAQGPMRI